MKKMQGKLLCLGMSLLLIVSCVSCIPKNNLKPEIKQGYYLKLGEPAPIEGWLMDKDTMYDIMQDALKNRSK